jgi:hypothetical protein
MRNFKYKGTIHFHDWGPLRKKIENCIVREEEAGNQEIVIDFKDNDKTYYTVRFNNLDKNNYKGEILNETKLPYSVMCRCYKYENNIALIGEWAQFGQDFYWICELEMESEIESD